MQLGSFVVLKTIRPYSLTLITIFVLLPAKAILLRASKNKLFSRSEWFMIIYPFTERKVQCTFCTLMYLGLYGKQLKNSNSFLGFFII